MHALSKTYHRDRSLYSFQISVHYSFFMQVLQRQGYVQNLTQMNNQGCRGQNLPLQARDGLCWLSSYSLEIS